MKLTTGIILLLLLCGCVHSMNMVQFETGQTLDAKYNTLDKSITVTMPDGQVLTGKYSALSNATVSFGSAFGVGNAFSGTKAVTSIGSATAYGITAGGRSSAYALLKSDKSNLMMEIVVIYSEWNGHGFGEAKTNDGRRYKVQF